MARRIACVEAASSFPLQQFSMSPLGPGTIRVRLVRARHALRERLEVTAGCGDDRLSTALREPEVGNETGA